MKMFSIGNHLTPYLLGISVALTGVLALESRGLVQTQADGTVRKQADTSRIARVNYSAPAIATFSEINERPLFRQDRQPAPPPKQSPVAARTSPLRLQLEGVALSPDAKIAVLRDVSTNQMLHLATGMKHQGWELTSITDSVATFKRGEQSQELKLKQD